MSNSLTRKNHIQNLLKELDTKGNAKYSFYEGLKTTGIALAGAGIGKVCGRPSLGIGLATIMLGHYNDSKRITLLGAGIMAGGGIAAAESVSGLGSTMTDKVKARIKEFGADIKHRLYLDKIIKPKTGSTTNGTDGLGNVQYFKYPNNELDMGALNAIEDEIARSTAQMQASQVTGYDDLAGDEDKLY